MIVGGYNIIDFEGEQFNNNQEFTVDSSTVDKLKDTTKPCVVGNLDFNSDGIKLFAAPMFSTHFVHDDNHSHIIGDIIISVTGDTTIKFTTK